MDIPRSERQTVALKSGNKCAFPKCGRDLILAESTESVITGEIAHIVGSSRQGPRGRLPLGDAERNQADNLIYLCEDHHKLIDKYPTIYSVAVLKQMKLDHEERVRKVLDGKSTLHPPVLVKETIHSTLLRVSNLPAMVYAAPCAFSDRQVKEVASRLNYGSTSKDELTPFLLRDGKLFAFHDFRTGRNPFQDVVDTRKTEEIPTLDFSETPEGSKRLIFLLNTSLRRLLHLRNVSFDKAHQRYFFAINGAGEERIERYKSLTGRKVSRSVVWLPKRRKTGEVKNHWLHLAASLQFQELSGNEWGFSIRLERHITTDGETPFPAKTVGRKVTRLKARLFNDAYLTEVHFWRDFLCGGSPRFILNFGRQSAIIESELISAEIEWPGVPDDEKSFTNLEYEEDLFSFSELNAATDGREASWEDEANDD